MQVKLKGWQKETNVLDVLKPRCQVDFLIMTPFSDYELYGQVGYVSRKNGNRKNDRKMWDAFLKEDSLLENDFSKNYYLEYTLFIEFVNYLLKSCTF